MKAIKDKIVERIEQLIQKGEAVKATHRPPPRNVITSLTLSDSSFSEWKTNCENLLILIGGKDSTYFANFSEKVKYPRHDHVSVGIGILKAIKEDVSLGLIDSLSDMVLAEVFTDFLDIADYLLSSGYKDPSASLIGAVLEDGLRKIAVKNNIQVTK